jgi:hypothetical protein
MERWLPVVGYEGFYEVSDRGRVRSLDRVDACNRRRGGHFLKQSRSASYPAACLYRDGSKRTLRVHCLVLTAFVGPCPNGTEGCHNDGDRSNNKLRNLRWGTYSSNASDKRLHGRLPIGEKHRNSVLTTSKVREAFEFREQGLSQRQIAEALGVSQHTVWNVLHRRAWKHVQTECA